MTSGGAGARGSPVPQAVSTAPAPTSMRQAIKLEGAFITRFDLRIGLAPGSSNGRASYFYHETETAAAAARRISLDMHSEILLSEAPSG